MSLNTNTQINTDRRKILSQNVFYGVSGVVLKVKKLVWDIYEQSGVVKNNNYLKKIPNLSWEELWQILSKIDNWEEISKKEKLLLIRRIEKNNPIYGILTNLNRWDKFWIIIFKWIKDLNDTTSQSFTDKVVNEFKSTVKKNHPEIKVIWNDWKNFVFKMSRTSAINQEELAKIMKNILVKNMKKSWIKKQDKSSWVDISNIIKVASTSSIISWRTQEDFVHNIAFARLSLEREWVKWLLTKEEIVAKEKELFQKYFNESKVKRKYLFDGEMYYVENNNLIREFKLNWRKKQEKTLIFYPNWDINIGFITKVRKKEIPTNCDFYNDFKILFDSYVARAEFIAPYIKRDDLEKWEILTSEELSDYKEAIGWIEQGKIKNPKKIRQLSENNYKNSLEKWVFYSKINQKWQLFYIDIKDMWSINMKDFSDKINMWSNWLLTAKEILLKSGDNMTIKFQNIIRELKGELKRIYPENKINISIWWDEIIVFVRWIDNNISAKKVIESLFKILKKNQVEWRVTERLIKEQNIQVGWEHLVETLDKLTKKTKEIEKRLEVIKQNLFLARKWISNNEENIEINKKISSFEKLRNFSLSIKDDIEYITFHDKPKNMEEEILLANVIDAKWNLKWDPPSPFIRYLDNHNLWRKKWRKTPPLVIPSQNVI
ncbi:MAG: hypothetical protein ACD_49C00086G0006 [uncultured bacterium (gcode 4)]|uniref:Uncharacterized protein n=1 Tax=uncultured bacterium (gcode 4) TaxID=1234023 RepID=K2ACS3_9BACT|nr:MAG: hypothetical protein ACD_49C00086G0006 [uncultured bacterium (gcode 4)]